MTFSNDRMTSNIDKATVRSFDDEWSRFDQTALEDGKRAEYLMSILPSSHGMPCLPMPAASTWAAVPGAGRD